MPTAPGGPDRDVAQNPESPKPARKRHDWNVGTRTNAAVVEAGASGDENRDAIDRTQRWVFATGAVATVAVVVASFVILQPLSDARDDLHTITTKSVPVQQKLADLRTTIVNWQVFIETKIDALAPGSTPPTTQVAQGVQLVQTQTEQAAVLVKELRGIGLTTQAATLDAAMKTFGTRIEQLTPIAAGRQVPASERAGLIGAERVAFEQLWVNTTGLNQQLSAGVTNAHTLSALEHLRHGRAMFLVGVVLDLALVLGAALVFGIRAGRRENARRKDARRRTFEIRLQKALDMTSSETAVYGILGASLEASVPRLRVEMLVADSSRARFHRALTNGSDFTGCGVASPADCPAITGGQTLSFPSSEALDACPHLKHRPPGASSAACFPVSIAGRTVGVLHALGADGVLPDADEFATLQFASRRGSDRIAMLRAFASPEVQSRTDALTGLLNRKSLEARVHDLNTDGASYSLAFGGIDGFQTLNDTHGREAGDQALRLFARVLRDSIRPSDVAARSSDEDFIVVLPDCSTEVAADLLRRVRERLSLALAAGRLPAFTVTFGIASTAYAVDFEDIVAIADRALLDARAAGVDRVAIAEIAAANRERVEPA